MVLKSLLPMVQVELQEGLEQIDYYAFEYCSSLEHICIPSTIMEIEPQMFRGCCSLSVVAFSNDEIEEFGNSYLLWEIWNNGTSEHSLAIYNFLHRYKIPTRLGKLHAQKWVSDIGARMRVVVSVDDLDWHGCIVYEYFESIDSKLKVYEALQDISSLLEMTIWKCKNYPLRRSHKKKSHKNIALDVKLQNRFSCGANVIIPNVLPSLPVDKVTQKRKHKIDWYMV